jgi:hypothetical protein
VRWRFQHSFFVVISDFLSMLLISGIPVLPLGCLGPVSIVSLNVSSFRVVPRSVLERFLAHPLASSKDLQVSWCFMIIEETIPR